MKNYLNRSILLGIVITLNIVVYTSVLAAAGGPTHESEEFEVFIDPKNPGVVRVPTVRHFPTEKEMEQAKRDWEAGDIKVRGQPVYSWITGNVVGRKDIDLSEGLMLLRRAAYYGHSDACDLLGRCFLFGYKGSPLKKTFAHGLSKSSEKATSLWEQSERYLAEGKEIPTKTLTLPEIWGPIERAKKAALKAAEEERAAVTTSEDIGLHLESKEPEDYTESNPLLGKDGLHHRRPSYYPGD